MTVEIRAAKLYELHDAMASSPVRAVEGAERKLNYLAMLSFRTWIGKVDNEIVCAFGVIPPSVLSLKAYLWSVTTDKVDEHKFLFVRYSQRMIETIHKEFPIIIGHANPEDERSLRWLRWLGARFGEPVEKGIPFTIERKDNGA